MKKMFCVALVFVMFSLGVTTLAEQVPSPSLPTEISAVVGNNNEAAVSADFTIQLTANTELTAAVLPEIEKLSQEDGMATVFGADAIAEAAEYLPEGYDASQLMLAEFYQILEHNYMAEYGDVEALFKLAVDYTIVYNKLV